MSKQPDHEINKKVLKFVQVLSVVIIILLLLNFPLAWLNKQLLPIGPKSKGPGLDIEFNEFSQINTDILVTFADKTTHKYSFGEYFNRQVNTYNQTECQIKIVLMGGSLAFGWGVEDNNTIQYLLANAQPGLCVFNLSYPYHAIQDVIEYGDKDGLLAKIKPDAVIYLFSPDDVRIASGHWTIFANGPSKGSPVISLHYLLDIDTNIDGTFKINGRFFEANPTKVRISNFVNGEIALFRTGSLLAQRLGLINDRELVPHFVRLADNAGEILNTNFNIPFYIYSTNVSVGNDLFIVANKQSITSELRKYSQTNPAYKLCTQELSLTDDYYADFMNTNQQIAADIRACINP